MLNKKFLLRGLPSIESPKDMTSENCKRNKQVKSSFHHKKMTTTSKPLPLLHMDLFGPMRTTSIGGKNIVFAIIGDFSRFTQVLFLAHRNDPFDLFSSFCKHIQRECDHSIVKIRSNHSGEFENENLKCFVISMALSTCSPHQEHHNKIVLLNGRIVQYKR